MMDPENDLRHPNEAEAFICLGMLYLLASAGTAEGFQEQIQFRHGRLPGQEYLDRLPKTRFGSIVKIPVERQSLMDPRPTNYEQ
jgi:hypothetical protein